MLKFLYETVPGRAVLKVLTMPALSVVLGKFMDSPLSKGVIPFFIKGNHIDTSEYDMTGFECFNDCFTRRLLPGKRVICREKSALIAPCDGYLSAYEINEDTVVPVKGSRYYISDLLKDKELAAGYEGGTCLVFRLCVHHYHRYIYPDKGTKGKNIHIPGVLHTVRPIAIRNVPVFTENSREYTVLHTENFGDVIQMEVGAMLVGRISNNMEEGSFERGDEKGRFEYGGSTIILLLQKDTAIVHPKLFESTKMGREMAVKMGRKIGDAI